MARFPFKEADVTQLCDEILAGLTAHPADFPYNDQPGLSILRNDYQTKKDAQLDAKAQFQLTTEKKNIAFRELIDKIKKEIALAEAFTAGDPVKLGYIGWRAKADPTSQAPGQPGNLEAVIQGAGTLLLDWKAPKGERVRVYDVERREKENGKFSKWHLIASAIESKANLLSQPRNREMEYRVIAKNTNGTSTPSNTVMVVL
ncbi:MAG: hypothetical protein IEMM0008_0711 [bacterium]|nr:MAG: hypothetical protein IEMM0008_0711 [bacterium]